MDAEAIAVLGVVALQAIQLAQTTLLGKQVRQSLRPPPPPSRGVRFDGDEETDTDTSPGRRRHR